MTTPSDADLVRKLITRTLLSLAFVGLLLFLAAGRLNWLEAWVYLGLMAPAAYGSSAAIRGCSKSAFAR